MDHVTERITRVKNVFTYETVREDETDSTSFAYTETDPAYNFSMLARYAEYGLTELSYDPETDTQVWEVTFTDYDYA